MSQPLARCARCEEPLGRQPLCGSCRFMNSDTDIDFLKSVRAVALDKVGITPRERLITGPWDVCWGGSDGLGIPTTSTTLIGGSPGVGKTSLFLQICRGALPRLPSDVLFFATEQSPEEIRFRADELGVDALDRIFVVEPSGPAELVELLNEHEPSLVILDSLTDLVGDNAQAAIFVLKELKRYAVRAKAPALVIDHVTKNDSFAGRMDIQHKVDVTLSFFPRGWDARKRGKIIPANVPRILMNEKNRHGPSYVSCLLRMTDRGFVMYDDAAPSEPTTDVTKGELYDLRSREDIDAGTLDHGFGRA